MFLIGIWYSISLKVLILTSKSLSSKRSSSCIVSSSSSPGSGNCLSILCDTLGQGNVLRGIENCSGVPFVTIMCRNDELSLMMSWVGCLLTDSVLPDTWKLR